MWFSDEQTHREIQDGVQNICDAFGDEYWLQKDAEAKFPLEFHRAIAEGGWLGIAMPTQHGGSGLGITEAAIMMRTISQSGAGLSGASSVHMNIFGLQPVVVFGTPEQQARMLPPLIAGREKACFAVTEPNAGLNTTRITTRAEPVPGGYRITGQKIWISTAQVADRALILARTDASGRSSRKTSGLSLFYAHLDRSRMEVREIRKLGRHAVDSNMLFFDAMPVPAEDLIGEAGEGFRQILHGLNPERVLVAAEAVGLGHAAIRKACEYARQRVVFDRPIGQYQAIQHPLSKAWMNLEAAWLMTLRAARLYDRGQECGAEANTAKYLAAEAAHAACETAVLTLGGMGYSAEYHVERYLRESWIPRIAPVSAQMIMNFIGEKVLDLPRSY